jgi:hypothetical protein
MSLTTCPHCNGNSITEGEPGPWLTCQECGFQFSHQTQGVLILPGPDGQPVLLPIEAERHTAEAGRGHVVELAGALPPSRRPDLMDVAEVVGQAPRAVTGVLLPAVRGVGDQQAPQAESKGEQPAEPKPAGMSWQEAAKRMERLRTQGDPFTSQHKLADLFGCSSGTINKAIRETPSLKAWAERQTAAAPKAQSLNDVVTDRTAQSKEPDPADDAAIREYLERDLTADERAFFNSLSRDDQLDFLDDPDKHRKILGRRP